MDITAPFLSISKIMSHSCFYKWINENDVIYNRWIDKEFTLKEKDIVLRVLQIAFNPDVSNIGKWDIQIASKFGKITQASLNVVKDYITDYISYVFNGNIIVFNDDGCLEHLILKSNGDIKTLYKLLQNIFTKAIKLPITIEDLR